MADFRLIEGGIDKRLIEGGIDKRLIEGVVSGVPDAPTIGTAVKGNVSATVAFTAPGNPGSSAIIDYTATSSPGGFTGTASASPITVTGLANGTDYTFTVTARNTQGSSAPSAASNSVTPSTIPGAPTSVVATGGNAQASVAFSAPASNGGATITSYTATSSPGGFTATGAGSPLTVTGLTNGTAYTFTVLATNLNGNSSSSSASSPVTPSIGSASFDGGGEYLTVATLNVTKTYPFWYGAFVRHMRDPVYATAYCVISSEKTDVSSGTVGFLSRLSVAGEVKTSVGNTSTFRSQQAPIPDPYWDHCLWELRSATDRRVYINGVREDDGSDVTSRTIDISTGAVTRIGARGNGIQIFNGNIANATFGSGTLTDGDRTTLATIGASYTGVTGIAHHYPLSVNGNDVIGTSHMTEVGAFVWSNEGPAVRAQPTTADIIQYAFKQATLRSETPTITAGALPAGYTALTGVSSVENLAVSFTGATGVWNTMLRHLIPVAVSLDHLVVIDGGHALASEAVTYGMDALAQNLITAGYGVVIHSMPGYEPTDPQYYVETLSTTGHNQDWALFSGSANPLERYFGPLSIALNNLSARYTKKSIVGLSGGGWFAAHYPAYDSRINHAAVAIRGTLAHRRRRSIIDFEQSAKATGWKAEEFHRLVAATNRRFWMINHPTDSCCFGQFDTGVGDGAYLNAATYRTAFIAPINAEFPSADVQFIEDTGISAHSVTAFAITQVMSALSTALSSGSSIAAISRHMSNMRRAA